MVTCMKKYKPVKLEEDVHENLLRLQALYVLRDGKKVSLNEIVKDLIDECPVWNISIEEEKKKST